MEIKVSMLLFTASGKRLSISAEGSERSKRMFQDIDPLLSASEGSTDNIRDVHTRNILEQSYVASSNSESRTSTLLRKANGASVIISKRSLEKCKALFHDTVPTIEATKPTRQAGPSIPLAVGQDIERSVIRKGADDRDEERSTAKRLKPPHLVGGLTDSIERIFELKWSSPDLSFQLQDIDKSNLLEDAVYLVGYPAAAHDSFTYFGRLRSLSMIDSSVAVTRDIDFQFDNESFTVIPTQLLRSDDSLSNELSSIRQSSCKNVLKYVVERLEASMTLSADDFSWVKMQLRWVALTLASMERRKPRDYLFSLFLGNIVVYSVLWRCSLYFHNRFDLSYFGDLKLNMVRCKHRGAGKVTAISHFSKRGSMSPLQRCSDILNLTWPLTVCFFSRKVIVADNPARPMVPLDSPVAVAADTSHSGRKIGKQSQYQFEVSDGWWWTSVVIDEGLLALFEKNFLKDGYKIVIFNAPFEIVDSGSKAAKKTIMKLSLNGVRKARGDAKLGFVNPKYLNRGIALKTIKPDAGPVFAVRFRVMHVTPMMCKLRFKTHPRRPVFLGPAETTVFHNSRDKMKLNVLNQMESSSALTLAHVLDAMCCDETVTRAILNEEDPSNYSDDIRDEIMATRRRVPIELDKMKSEFYNEALARFEVDELYYSDVLAMCAISSQHCWIRFQHGHGHGGDCAGNEYMDPAIAKGKHLSMTHLKPVRSPYSGSGDSGGGGLCKTLLLQCNPNSTVKLLSPSRAGEVSSTYGIVDDLRAYFDGSSSSSSSAAGGEVSFEMALVEWTVTEGGPVGEGDEKHPNLSLYDLELIGYSASRVCVVMKFGVYSKDVAKSLPWLLKNSVVSVTHAIVDSVDRSKEIITVGRFDRTLITAARESGSMAPVPHVAEEISRRVAALRSSCLFYPSVHQGHEFESCTRDHITNAAVRIGSQVFSQQDVLLKVKVSSSPLAEWENMIISQDILRICVPYEIDSDRVATDTRFNLSVVQCSKEFNNNSISEDIYLQRRVKWMSYFKQ